MSLVICPEVHAAKAGHDLFAVGGNAMDAAIGAAFVQGVTNHLLCGLGGTLSIYYYEAERQRHLIINAEQSGGSKPTPTGWASELEDGLTEVSLKYRIKSRANELGYQAIMVPGFVRGCWYAFRAFGSGRVSWREILAPAVALARDGFEIPPYQAQFFRHLSQWESRAYQERGFVPKWEISSYARQLFLRDDGRPYEQGDRFVQPDLAHTLERLATGGGDDFYEGALSTQIAADLIKNDALITAEDLANYRVIEDGALTGTYHGFTLYAQPYSNGCHLIELLQILDRLDVGSLGHNTAAYVETVAAAMRAAATDYLRVKGLDRDAIEPVEQELVSADRADYWAARIRSGDPVTSLASATSRWTTHLTAADDNQNLVSLNHSIGFGGAGVATPGLGFLYNADVASYDPRPGRLESISPNTRFQGGSPIALFDGVKPYIVLGAPGGTRIVTSIVQSILNVVEHGMDMRTAVTAPRFHSQEGRVVDLEPEIKDQTANELAGRGNEVRRSRYQARPQAIRLVGDRMEGGSDPRGHGSEGSQFPPYDWSMDPALIAGGGG